MHVEADHPLGKTPFAIGAAAIMVEVAHCENVFDLTASVLACAIGQNVHGNGIDLARASAGGAVNLDQVVADMVSAIGNGRHGLIDEGAIGVCRAIKHIAVGVGGISSE